MAYELFTIKLTRLGSPTLTVNPDGTVYLNADAGDLLWRTAGVNSVEILWDKELSRMALRPLEKPSESSYKLLTRGKRRSTSFSALTFFKYIGWNLSKSVVVPVEWNANENVLEAALPRENIKHSQCEKP
jgi:hypothetical protein